MVHIAHKKLYVGGIDNSDWAKMIYEFVNANHAGYVRSTKCKTVCVMYWNAISSVTMIVSSNS